jgi:tetratricopeptide (TPR) repeat protein
MDRIKSLYTTLNKSEIKALKTYLSAFHSKGENKPLELLRLIEKRPEITQDVAAKKLYGDPRSKAFIMMKSRLFEKMTEFLSLSVNPGAASRRNKDMPYFQDLTEYRKNMLAAVVLRERRLRNLSREAMDKSLKIAKKCSNPELEIDVLLRIRGGHASTEKVFEELTLAIRDAMERQERDISAVGIHNKFLRMHNLRSSMDNKKIEFLERNLPPLEDSLRQKYSPRADYHLQLLKVFYYSLTGEYEKCKAAADASIAVLDRFPGIRNRMRVADPYFQLGLLELKFHRYDAAIEAMEKAVEYQVPHSRGMLMILLIQLYPLILKGELEEAAAQCDRIDEMLKKPFNTSVDALKGLFFYLKSCVRYRQRNYQEAWATLQEAHELNFDKEGWLSGIRVFEIMILLDRGNGDLASQKLENLRKHLSRYSTDPRLDTIYKLLNHQERMGFLFSHFKGEEDLLRDLAEVHRWKHNGHEVIRFDDWYKEKRGI